MSRSSQLTDEELGARLADELGQQPAAAIDEWVRGELRPAVRSRLTARPQVVRTSRLAALGAASALILVLALLVVAAPTLGPAAETPAPSPSPTPPNTWSSMGAPEFAARVAAGELREGWYYVSAGIGGEIPAEFCPPPGPCPIGRLLGVPDEPFVFARWLPTTESETATQAEVEDVAWRWWELPLPPPPSGRALILAVTADGQIEFVGHQPEELFAYELGHLPAIDTAEQSDLVVVPGWLTAVGVGLPFSGAPPPASIAGLPQRWSGSPAWILDRPMRLDPEGYFPPDDGVQVQNSAYEQFSVLRPTSQITEPDPGLYALAKRLEGAGCPDNVVPCWQWNLVARVTYEEFGPAEPVATPPVTRSPSPTDSPSASPTEPSQAGIQCRHFVTVPGGSTEPPLGWSASVLDSTGLVSFCQMFRGPDDAEPQLTITSPGEPTGGSLVVTWLGAGCDPVVEVRFGRVGESFSLHVMEANDRPPGIVCDAANVSRGVVLSFDEPVDPADIVTSLNGQPPPPQQPAPAHLCPYATDPSSEIDVTLADHLDAVTGCVAGRADQVEGGARIDNPADDTSRLLIEWTVPEICERWPAGLELWPNTAEDANTSYLLTINVRRYDGPQGCLAAVSGQSAELELRQPIQAEEVEIVLMYDGRASDSVELGGDRYSIELAPQQSQYVAGEPIDIAAHFMFEGGAPDEELTLSGYRSGLTYEQLDGELLMEGAHSLECDETTVRSGEPRPVPVQNVTGTSADDPYAAFYFEWMQTPYLWLPAGTWRVDLYVSLTLGPGCTGEEVRLHATTILEVVDAEAQAPVATPPP